MKQPGGLKLLSMLRSWIWLLPLCPPRTPLSRSQNSSPKRPCKRNCIAGGREEAVLDEWSQLPRPGHPQATRKPAAAHPQATRRPPAGQPQGVALLYTRRLSKPYIVGPPLAGGLGGGLGGGLPVACGLAGGLGLSCLLAGGLRACG